MLSVCSISALSFALALVQAAPWPQSQSISQNSVAVTVTATSAAVSPSNSAVITAQNPCAAVAQIYLQNINGSTGDIRVPAQLAWNCLNDVPLDTPSAIPWLASLRPYMEWQSTTAYLKAPPSGYLEPAVDVWGNFNAIRARLNVGNYTNEYQLEYDIYNLFQSTHDGHFRYIPTMVGGIFAFGRPISLVSYSLDGTAEPKIYVYSDVLSHFVNGTAIPSALKSINGQNAVSYLEDWSQYGSLQDPDALYNNVFYELGQASLGATGSGAGTFAGGGRGAYIYPGANTTLTFENGTITSFPNFARILIPFRGITNGTILYRTWVNPYATKSAASNLDAENADTSSSSVTAATTITTTKTSASATSRTTTGTPRPGYPSPVLSQRNNYVGGWYLNDSKYQDVAVLGVQSFVGAPDFQDVVYNFLDMASKAGKTKLVIDVSANGGGTILQGYNMFKNLFPDITPYGASRYRDHEAFNIIGQTVSDRIPVYPYNTTSNLTNPAWLNFVGGVPFNYRANLDVNNQNFMYWKQVDPPNAFYGDQFSALIRWNLSDPTNVKSSGLQVNGYGNRTGLPPARPFKPENIVILYDGYCASTCGIFSEFMTQQAGIKTIAIGGRPNKGAPMQAVGGVKGTNDYPWSLIYNFVSNVYRFAPDLAGYFNSTALYNYINPQTYETPFFRAVGDGSVNVRDGIRQGDTTQTPLQFIYQAANCRIYYTAEMTVDVTAMWEKAADVAWGGGTCVEGSIGHSKKLSKAKREELRKQETERLRKRLTHITRSDAAALEESMNLFTDLTNVEVQQGMMLP